jgi:hypothetical protein
VAEKPHTLRERRERDVTLEDAEVI